MREMYVPDWAAGIVGALRDLVRRNVPDKEKVWPLLNGGYECEAYNLDGQMVIALRGRGLIPQGPGMPGDWPHTDHPKEQPSRKNIGEWVFYLATKLQLGPRDIAMILPIHDCGRNDARGDFELYSEEEKLLWNAQLQAAMGKLHQVVKAAP